MGMLRVLLVCLCVCVSPSLWGGPGPIGAAAADSSCSWTEPNTKQRFDFDQLAIKQGDTWQGVNNVGGWNSSDPCTTAGCGSDPYQYLFNLCAPLAKPPNVCSGDSVLVYQYTTKKCYVAAKYQANNPPQYGLLVDNKPSQGFTVTYGGGDTCSSGSARQFRLHLRCSANLPADPQLSHDSAQLAPTNAGSCTPDYSSFHPDCRISIGHVYEDPDTRCLYHVHINTIFGCPSNCRTGATACSDHGICAEDTDAGVTRCFCDKGWGGDTCQIAVDTSAATTSRSPNTVLTVFVLILLFAALGVGYALYRKIRGFHGDFDHQYGQLEDGVKSAGSGSGRGGIQINNS